MIALVLFVGLFLLACAVIGDGFRIMWRHKILWGIAVGTFIIWEIVSK